jgi:ketosteroid isomerase-like protein
LTSRLPADVIAAIAARVPATLGRDHIAAAVAAYFASFETRALEARLALFADDVHFEDPAGRLVASDRAGLREFFGEIVPSDWDVRFILERVAIVGDEALATATMRVSAGDADPIDVIVNCHFAFGGDGRIRSYRAFFDGQSIIERR